MSTEYYCDKELRRKELADSTTINGIDYLEVHDTDSVVGEAVQRVLKVCFLNIYSI